MNTEDCFIKDEGEFITVGFVSDKAKKLIKTAAPDDILYGEDILKMDILLKSKNKITEWLISHNLTFSSDI